MAKKSAIVVVLAMAALSVLIGSQGAAVTPPLGDSVVEATADPSPLGAAEANQFIASSTASVSVLIIFVDASNRASAIALGLYADQQGVPGALIAQGQITSVQNGAWNRAPIAATTLTAGTPYWIARLSTSGGDLVTRVNGAVMNPDRVDARPATTLPATFSPAASYPHVTSMYADVAGSPTPGPTATPSPTVTQTPAPTPTPTPAFVGDASIAPNADPSSLGTAEANRFVATAGGDVRSISIYLDASNRSSRIALGLYSDAGSAPGTLLAQGSLSTVVNGAWNTIGIPPTTIANGTAYWIARLSLAGGDLVTRVDPSVTNADRVDTSYATSLPSVFNAGASYPHLTSMYASAAAGPATATPTPTPATPAPTATPSGGGFVCTQVMGYSQTGNWYSQQVTGAFESVVDDSRYQLLNYDGGAVWRWADPNYGGWYNAPFSPCANGSSAPDRVIFDVTESFWVDEPCGAHAWDDCNGDPDTSVTRVANDIARMLATLRQKYPSVREIYVQAVLGGPQGTVCSIPDSSGTMHAIRGTWNNPRIEDAIRQAVSGNAVAGPHFEVRSCSDFADDGQYVGHLITAAKGPMGQTIGAFYAARP